QLAERHGAAHRLRRAARPATVPRAGRVRASQRAVNTASGRN
ncbi:GntR family transcriptional regulator, partial [Streptomyces sp. SID2563]|nr:GntR family transcriptional regulator [Streptomyces sp. SID2563]